MKNSYRFPNRGGADSLATSPGFTWGRSGNVGSGAYLLNDTVPSNLAGRIIPITEGVISEIFVAVENNSTCVFSIEKRSGSSFIEVATISLSSQRTATAAYSISIAYGEELACKVKSGSAKNPVVGVVIKGDSS